MRFHIGIVELLVLDRVVPLTRDAKVLVVDRKEQRLAEVQHVHRDDLLKWEDFPVHLQAVFVPQHFSFKDIDLPVIVGDEIQFFVL